MCPSRTESFMTKGLGILDRTLHCTGAPVHYLPLNVHLKSALFIIYLWIIPCSLFALMAALSVLKQFRLQRDKIFAFTFYFVANYKVASKLSKNWQNILKGYGQRCLVTACSSLWHLFKQRTNTIYAEAVQILISQLQWYDPALYWPRRKENLQNFCQTSLQL